MKSGDKIIFTVRNEIKGEPRITQERTYVTLFEYRLISNWDLFYTLEKDKDKKADKQKLEYFKKEMHKISHGKDKFECFSDNSIYLKCLNKFVDSKEGWYNSKIV